MAWMSMRDDRGRGWAVNPDGCAHIYRSNQYNRLLVARSRIVQVNQGFLLPTLAQVETDFRNIRQATTHAARASVQEIQRDIATNPRSLYEHLVAVREDAERAGEHYRDMMQQASRQAAAAVQSNVDRWENALAAAKFVRDVSAGTLMVGATILSGGAALGIGAAGTGLTFTANTQDNLQSNQSLRQAMGNAAVSTSVSVATNILIPKGLSAVGRSMVGAGQSLSTGQNVALGLLTVQANTVGDIVKTALTADQSTAQARQQFQQQISRQVGARTATEVAGMLFGAWLQSRGVPASVSVEMRELAGQARDSVSGGMLSAIGDRIVAAMSTQDQVATAANLDLAFTRLRRAADAEAYVREVAMRPA